jgi:hypothetical protein
MKLGSLTSNLEDEGGCSGQENRWIIKRVHKRAHCSYPKNGSRCLLVCRVDRDLDRAYICAVKDMNNEWLLKTDWVCVMITHSRMGDALCTPTLRMMGRHYRTMCSHNDGRKCEWNGCKVLWIYQTSIMHGSIKCLWRTHSRIPTGSVVQERNSDLS